MYKIYIKNFISENDPSLLDYSEVLFDSSDIQYDEFDRTVSEPVVKEGLNKSGSFEFTVSPQNPYYDRIKIIKTLFTVYLDDEMIFRGRVMSMTDDLYRQRSVFCEGELAYLNDSLQPPVKEDVLGPSDFFKKMITDHNEQMNLFKSKLKPGDDPKTFEKGVSDVGDNGLSYVRVSGTGEIVLTDENGNYVISGSEAIRAQFSWEIGSVNGTTGANEDSVYYIRSVDPVEVKFGSIVKVVSGYKAAVITYYTESNTDKVMTSGLFTDQYWVQKDGRIRIIITRDLESGAEQQAFTATDVSTVPDEALILTGLSMTAISHHEHSVTMTPFNSTSYRNTLDAIESDLINVYGGYLSVRYANGKRYIDYTKDPPHNNESQRIISFGVNLQELSKEINGEEIYSILLPTGDSNLLLKESKKNQLLTNTQSIYLPLDSAISEFGPIFKTQAFSGVTKRDDLQDYASNYVDKTYHGAAASYTIKAVDMHFVDPSHRLIRAGSKCRITLWPAQIIQNRTCTEATFELQSPENNEYVFESISNERDSLTSKYKKQTSASRRSNYGVSTTPTTAESGAGSEDTVIRSNGNIILYPGTDKMVSIPLAKTFLAPNLTNWSLGAVKYTSSGGLKVDNKAEIGQNLLVKGKAIIGSSTDMFSSMPVSTTLFVNGGIHGKLIRGSTIMVGSTGLGSDGQFRIMKSDTTPGANIYQPVQLKLIGGKDENGADIVLADMWVLGNKNVNFNIADTTWFKERAGIINDVKILSDHSYDNLKDFVADTTERSKTLVLGSYPKQEIYSNFEITFDNGKKYYFGLNASALVNSVKNGVNVSDAKILSDHSYDNLSDFVADTTERSKTLVLGSYPKKEIYSNFEITLDNGNKYYFGLNASALVNSVKNDVGITGPFWTDGNNKPDGYTYPTWAYVNYKTDSSSPKTTDDLKLYIVGEGFTEHKKNVYLVEGSGSVSSGTIRAQLIVDASTEYRTGYKTGQDNVSASIGDISYTSKSASYENGSLLLAASASGTLTKKSISGSDVTSPISSGSKLLDIPVTVGTVTVNTPQWKNGKYTITADGSLKVDDETISLYQGSIAGGFVPTDALNSVKVKKGTWSGKTITFTTDAPTPNANAPQTLTLSWNNDTTWSWDDDNGYQQKYQIKDVATVIDTVYATIPDMAVGLTEPGTQQSTWWKTSGTNANKYVIPGTSAAAYLATDTSKAHPLSVLKTGSDIVITPTEAINAGFKIAHDSITLSQTGSSVVKPGKSVTIYPKALSDATDTSPDNITAISAILTAPAATKTDKVILESTDISNNVSKTGIIVHYSDNSTTNGLQVLIDASAVYSAGIAKGESQGSSAGKITGINLVTPRGSYSSTEEMFTLNLQATGTDITNAPYNSSVKFAVSGSALALTKGSLTNNDTDANDNVYKGRYSVKRNSGGVFKIESIDTITASVTSLPIDLELAPPVKTLDSGGASNWNSEDHKYVYDLTASLSVDGTTTLKRQVKNLELVPTNAIDYGKTLVTVSSVTRTENCVYDIEQETAFDNVIVELSNGKKVVKGVDFSDVYRNAAHGISYAEEQNYTVELVDFEGNYVGEEDFLLNVEDIMYKGNRDSATISRRRYIYSSSGDPIHAYGKTSSLPRVADQIGSIYPNTLVTYLGQTTSSGIGGWVQINCEGTTCYLYTTNPDNVLHTSPDSPSNYGNLRGWRYDGQTVTYDYTGTVDTNGAATINIYASRSTTSTVLATLSNNQNISCMYLPKNYADEFMPVKIGSTEGYVESKYIVGTNAYLELHPDTPVMQSIIINHVYQNIKLEDNSTYTKSYDVTMKTVLNNSKVAIETEPMTATAYRNITTNIESSELSKYLSRINYFYGKMAVAGITEGTRNHKVEFTVSYSNGDSNTYIAEIEVKNDVQAETYDYYGFVYAYSGKTVNMRIEPSKSSTVVCQVPVNSRIACKYDPAEYAGVEEGDTAEWMPVQYDGYTGYMQAKYIRTTNAYEEDPGGESEDKKPSSVTIDRIIYEGTANGSVVVKLKDTSSALPHKLTAVNKTEYMIAARRANAEMATYFEKADDAGHYAWHSHTAPSSSILAIVVCLVVRYQDGVTKDLFIKATSFPH